ncbi:hypothetical protein [Kribbella sp. NPDC048928]|uniref:hypothetical protein n=1 Tax=Kribbella sp. NPDC048928 TaxID=3364111 RepID=UPI00371E2236
MDSSGSGSFVSFEETYWADRITLDEPIPETAFGSMMSEGTISLILSSLALAVSCVATVLSWRSHRRQGALVTLELEIHEPALDANDQLFPGSVAVRLSNQGLASVGVGSMMWIIEVPEYTVVSMIEPSQGPSVPLTLAGLHSADWYFSLETIQEKVAFQAARARVIFDLGGNRERTTPWRNVPVESARDFEENVPVEHNPRMLAVSSNSEKKAKRKRKASAKRIARTERD